MRLYHLIAVSERTGKVTLMTSAPMTHEEACTMSYKFSYHPLRRIRLIELAEWEARKN